MMDALQIYVDRYISNEKYKRFSLLLVIVLLIIGVYLLVYYTGGIKYVYSHSMYIPIILAAFFFGIKGGVIAGIAGGVVLGPFMPIDIVTGEKQQLINWLYRMGFFTLIGAVTGASMASLRKRIKEINWLRQHNRYTQLPNEESLNETLEKLIQENVFKRPYFLLAIGSSNFARIKTTFGFSVIHVIIQQMNQRLNECLLFNHGIFNYNDERMAVVLEESEKTGINDEIKKIVSALELPYEYEHIPVHIDVHIGCVEISDSGSTPYTLERKAEAALNTAMDDKIDFRIYEQESEKTNIQNLGLLGSLRSAIDMDQLVLYYQPKVDISSKKLLGVEALIRWHHPNEGMIPPGRFVPQAEQTNLINPLTMWVIENATSRMESWDKMGFTPAVAVNISTRNLNSPGFEDNLFELLEKYRIEPGRLELEVTESALMQDPRNAIRLLTELADSNIIISIDDFGTGYSSLEYLCKLPASIVKIDQYFVKNLVNDDAIKNVIQSATDLAHSLDMTVVAEGVENREILDFLGNIGIDIVQGYFISKPMCESDLLAFAQNN